MSVWQMPDEILVGMRSSALAKAQFKELMGIVKKRHPSLKLLSFYVTTEGDHDRRQSLRNLEKSDFFTKEIDGLQLAGFFPLALHSAKDLPSPLRKGLSVLAMTKSISPRDFLILKEDMLLENLPARPKIATSSHRRMKALSSFLGEIEACEIRGDVEARLAELDRGHCDGLVVAEAALLRLKIERKGIPLPCEGAEHQGRLALVAREEDWTMRELFSPLDNA